MRLRELAGLIRAELRGDGDREIDRLAPASSAGENALTFLANPRYRNQVKESRAGAILAASGEGLEGRDLLLHPNPYAAWAKALALFHPPKKFAPGVHPTAVVGEDCEISSLAHVGPHAVVGRGCRIGDGAVIGPLCCLGDGCVVGRDSRLYPGVVLYDGVELGERVVLHSGAVVGSDGFGYAEDSGSIMKVPQVGTVAVGDDAEIGANTTIDRGALDKTVIGAGSKVDNLCQVAHNVVLGRNCVIIAQSGISGSTKLGDGVVMSGQSGAVGHVKIGSGAVIGAKSAVTKDVPERAHYTGIPAEEHRQWLKERALLRKVEKMHRALKKKGILGEENEDD